MVIDLQSFLAGGEVMTKHTCSGPTLAGVQDLLEMYICTSASWPYLCSWIHLHDSVLQLPGTETPHRGDCNGRDSWEDRKHHMVT